MADWKKIVLTVAIAIMFVLFVGFGIEAFYDSPKYQDFCDEMKINVYDSKEECEAAGARWNVRERMPISIKADEYLCTKANVETSEDFVFNCKTVEDIERETGWCDIHSACNEEYRSVRDVYNRNVFIVAAIMGLIAIFLGGISLNKESVGSGVMGGGILTVMYGTIRYWEGLGEIMRFILLGLILALLIWIGYKKIKD